MCAMPLRIECVLDKRDDDPVSVREFLEASGLRKEEYIKLVSWWFTQKMNEGERALALAEWMDLKGGD